MVNTNSRYYAFLKSLTVSEITKKHYISSLNDKLLLDTLKERTDVKSVFEVSDIKLLWDIYVIINVHPINISRHRNISCALMKYIKFLNNGKKVGRRVDFRGEIIIG